MTICHKIFFTIINKVHEKTKNNNELILLTSISWYSLYLCAIKLHVRTLVLNLHDEQVLLILRQLYICNLWKVRYHVGQMSLTCTGMLFSVYNPLIFWPRFLENFTVSGAEPNMMSLKMQPKTLKEKRLWLNWPVWPRVFSRENTTKTSPEE